ncbi:hypothetical protein SEA_TINABELCHER_81 [Streptomyces phage TinaBelcher]|nr:hypothetical protein SEA_TINABELCHER_81 [Streptomyces phage TinaBelcher]
MDHCTYDLDHSAVAATHYYRAYEGDRVMLCFGCASRFGYPQYLVQINKPVRQSGYLIQVFDGTGMDDPVTAVWPFESDQAESWVRTITACTRESAEWLVGDAAYDPYNPQYLDSADLTVEVTRVTCLSLV